MVELAGTSSVFRGSDGLKFRVIAFCLTLLGPAHAAAKRQPSGAPATRSVAARRGWVPQRETNSFGLWSLRGNRFGVRGSRSADRLSRPFALILAHAP